MPSYHIPIPHSRGLKLCHTGSDVNDASTAVDCIEDLFLYATFARIATRIGETHEFKTNFNSETKVLELDIPDDVLGFIESVLAGHNLERFLAWLVSSSGLIRIDNNFDVPTVDLDHIIATSYAYYTIPNNDGGTIDWVNGNKQIITLTSATTLTFTAPQGPTALQLIIKQDNVGGHNVVWPTGVKWPNGGTVGVITLAANAVDILSLVYDGDDVYYATLIKNFM